MSTDKQLLHLPTEVATAPKSVRSGGERTRRFNHNRTRLKATATSSQSETASHERSSKGLIDQSANTNEINSTSTPRDVQESKT